MGDNREVIEVDLETMVEGEALEKAIRSAVKEMGGDGISVDDVYKRTYGVGDDRVRLMRIFSHRVYSVKGSSLDGVDILLYGNDAPTFVNVRADFDEYCESDLEAYLTSIYQKINSDK